LVEPYFITPNWPAPSNIQAYTSCRMGGDSLPPFDTFNVGLHVGDDRIRVEHNRGKLPHIEQYQWLTQTHSNVCIELPSTQQSMPAADACFTAQINQVCAVMTADCLPILLCNTQGDKVAAVHAGWRGLANNIIENTIQQMNCGNQSILAWLGPAISQQYFEVGKDVKQAFAHYPDAFIPSVNFSVDEPKYLANLYAIALKKLAAIGILNVYGGDYCTYGQDDLFFSHRRATHQGLSTTGRMVTSIYIT
jgi:polyphenol oxidase